MRSAGGENALYVEIVQAGLLLVDTRQRELRVQTVAVSIVGVDVDRLVENEASLSLSSLASMPWRFRVGHLPLNRCAFVLPNANHGVFDPPHVRLARLETFQHLREQLFERGFLT
jgi:hypothetical protein